MRLAKAPPSHVSTRNGAGWDPPRPPLDSTFEGAIGSELPVLAFPHAAETEEVCDGGVQADLGGFSHRRTAGHVYRAHRAEVPRPGAEDGAPQDPERPGISSPGAPRHARRDPRGRPSGRATLARP